MNEEGNLDKDIAILDGEGDVKPEVDPKPEKVEKEVEESVEKVEEEEVEEKEEEQELDEDGNPKEKVATEEESEEETEIPEGRVSPKVVKAKFPEIFKEFPDLRRVIAHENEYGKLFGSVEVARKAAEAVESFDVLGKKIMDGDAKFLLTEVAKENPESFEKFSTNFLASVRELHPPTFAKIVTPLVKGLLKSAQASPDINYKRAGQWMQKFLQLESLEDTPEDPRIKSKELELTREKERISEERFETFRDDVHTEGNERLSSMIVQGLDPENVMSPAMRKAVVREVFEQVNDLVSRDEVHMRRMSQLWMQAKQNGMGREAREQIIRAFLARVKPVLPGIRQKVREDYLGSRRVRKEGEEKPKPKNYIPSSGSQGGNKPKKLDPDKIDKDFYKKHSDADILDM